MERVQPVDAKLQRQVNRLLLAVAEAEAPAGSAAPSKRHAANAPTVDKAKGKGKGEGKRARADADSDDSGGYSDDVGSDSDSGAEALGSRAGAKRTPGARGADKSKMFEDLLKAHSRNGKKVRGRTPGPRLWCDTPRRRVRTTVFSHECTFL